MINSEIADGSDLNYSEVTVTMNEVTDLEKWIDVVCVMMKTIGALECITIIGAIIGIPLIFGSLRLRDAKELIVNYANTGNSASLHQSLSSLKNFFIVLILISLIYFAIIACIIIGLAIFIS